jgi:hypothetical protein
LPVGALAEVYGAPAVMAGTAGLGILSGMLLMAWYARQARGSDLEASAAVAPSRAPGAGSPAD